MLPKVKLTLPKLTPQQRWDQVVKREARGIKTRHKLETNRHRNWLIALTAHACAKAQGPSELSDLEQHLVEMLRKASQKIDLVAAFAYIQSATPPEIKNEIFPSGFEKLNLSDSVTFAKLGELAPSLAKQTVAAPNTNNIDIQGIHLGQVKLRDQIKASREVLGVHANSLLNTVSQSPVKARSGSTPIANRYMIKATAFRCLEESSEASASDEVYWLFASIAPGYQAASSSHLFNDVDQGEGFPFESNEGCFWGMDCQPHTFPDGEIGAVVALMEHDSGNIGDVQKAWFAGVAGLGGILAATGVAAWVAAVVAALGGFIGVLIGFMEDDQIADQGFTWDRNSINEVIDKHGGFYDHTAVLTDGDATYRLRIRVSRVV